MPNAKFHVTYEIVTPESAEQGDAEERGFICKNASLRDAISEFTATRTAHCDGIIGLSADSWPLNMPRWFTVDNGMEYLTGAHESRSLHMPDNMTNASRLRLARLLGVK